MGKRKRKADVSDTDADESPGAESNATENLLYMEAIELSGAPNTEVKHDPKYGTPLKFDPDFKGPIKKRSCTDVICCLLFFIFILGLIVVAYFAFAYGNPKLLLYPVNSDGELCGFGNQRGKPNLFFFDLVKCGRMGPGVFVAGCPTPQICVLDCPKENFVFNWVTGTPDKLKYCIPDVDKSSLTTNQDAKGLVKDDKCAAYYMESKPLLHRCVPKVLADLLDAGGNFLDAFDKGGPNVTFKDSSENPITNEMMNLGLDVMGQFLKAKEYAEKVIQDVVSSWYMILACLVMAMFVSLIWIVIMRWLAAPMVWITILAFVGLFGFGCYWCFRQYMETKDTDEMFTLHMGFSMQFEQSKVWLGIGITTAIILALTLLVLLFLCHRIRIAIQLIKMGSRAVGNMMFTLLFPVFPFALQLGTVGMWAAIAVFLASTGREQSFNDFNQTFPNGTLDYDGIKNSLEKVLDCKENSDPNKTTSFSDICGALQFAQDNFTKNVIYLQIFNLFMLFWVVNFFIALGQMTLAGAFASYYWAFNKPKDVPTFPLAAAVWRCFRYHLGSLAFGSLIIAIVQIIRVFLEYLDSKMKASENPVAKFFLKCLKCCFWCLEKFLKFLNKNAYIMVAVYGKNFCVSAKNAFLLLMRNCVRVVVVDKVTDFLLFIGKLVIVGAVGAASFFFFNGQITFLQTYNPSLNFYFVPVVLVVIGSYIVASCFFSVYSMAVDTLFLCFLEDLERNDGSPEKPYYMPKGLMKLLDKKNKLKDKDDD